MKELGHFPELRTQIPESRNATLRQMIENDQTPVLDFELERSRKRFTELMETQKNNGSLLAQSMQDSSETWHDNAAAEAISAESRGLASQASILTKILNQGTIVEYPQADFDRVTLGSIVLVDFGDGEDEPMLITGVTTNISEIEGYDWPENYESVTVKSPLGRALIDSQVGDAVKYSVNGREISVTVKDIHQFSA